MSDSSLPSNVGARELIALPDALRALPQATPAISAWPALAAGLAASARTDPAGQRETSVRRRRRLALPAALAAAIVFAFAVTALLRTPRPHATTAPALSIATKSTAPASSVHHAATATNADVESATRAEDLAALQTRSHALERWLRDTSKDSAPQSAPDLAASAEIEDMIGLIDVQLTSTDTAQAAALLPLWRRRVALLEDLSMLRYGANLAQFKSGMFASEDPVGGHRAAAATWNN